MQRSPNFALPCAIFIFCIGHDFAHSPHPLHRAISRLGLRLAKGVLSQIFIQSRCLKSPAIRHSTPSPSCGGLPAANACATCSSLALAPPLDHALVFLRRIAKNRNIEDKCRHFHVYAARYLRSRSLSILAAQPAQSPLKISIVAIIKMFLPRKFALFSQISSRTICGRSLK